MARIGNMETCEELMETLKAPPLELIKAKEWKKNIQRERIGNIISAMYRFGDAKKEIPLEWILELSGLWDVFGQEDQ